ncbi:DEAD/DEAH box helicase [Micromonospora matsumotoense]|uniref:DEAD/DEAH box helicase n=1 Tax=Micromonospora matsumotoense TaxID=121616 RepID=UPI003D8CF645
MERSLDLALLHDALAGRTNLPSAEELQQLIADVEVHLFLRDLQIAQELLDSAWYLHAVASIHEARQRYSLPRQRQAFLVSAHIFDLALNQEGWGRAERLSFGFAAAIGYRRGGRDPNATAIMNRLRDDIDVTGPVTDHFATLSLEAGLAFLGFETRTLFRWFGTWRRQLNTVARDAGTDDLRTTALGPSQMVVLGAEDLLMYLATGRSDRLETGVERLRMAAVGEAGPEDLHARWVASHLLGLSGEVQAGSLWNPNVLPPDVSALVRQSFTMGSPPVMTLWEPQRALLTKTRSPFDPDVRRMVLAVPTSGGKTLVGQLLSVEHIDRTDRSVCYVVPTRSLGREVRRAMSSRIRVLQKETGAEQADFSSLWGLFDAVRDDDPADVEVMTPERLAHLLRHDVAAVLDRFGLFIFDEAQLLKETGRGFTLEAVIALLDYLTAQTDHKIILISAAMGNAGEIAQWLDPAGRCLRFESQWRGPRRLHAAFTTTANWNDTRVEGGAGSKWRFRHTTPLTGHFRLRLAENRTAGLTVTPDVEWVLVQKSERRLSREKIIDSGRTTKKYMIASETITLLGHAGSVLVVATTRKQAQQLAGGIAEFCEEQPGLAALVDFVRQQLGDDHPLVGVLKRGVGFHHAGLPVEVLEALEGAVRDDTLPYLTCTSTLTDGVNLPVRTVIIYDQPFPDQSEESRLSGARLVNAMGRAGRAGKETEGWIVLVRAAEPTEQDFHDLNPSAESLAVTSSLITDEALGAFASLEDELRATEDAIFTTFDQAGDFISFVWLALSIEEGRGIDPADVDLSSIVGATLAARQSPEARRACAQIADTIRRRYVASDPQSRRRWARTGTSIGSARTIDALATRIASAIERAEAAGTLPDLLTPVSAIRQLPTLFTELLDLAEAPDWQFKISPRGAEITVRPVDLLADWVSGQTLPELANTHLAPVTDPAFRIEQMVGAASEQFEHFLAWTVGAVVDIVNAHLLDAGSEARLCPELAGYIRYGVDSPHALRLMTSGIRSRRLAHAISRDRPRDLQATHDDLRAWLAGMGITEWRDRYDASASEVLDLLDYTRLRSRSLLKALLETGSVTLDVLDVQDPNERQDLSIRPVEGDPEPARIAVWSDTQAVAHVSAADHTDIQAILDTGLAFEAELSGTSLRITLPLDAAE